MENMIYYYMAPIENGIFTNVDYHTILEGIAFDWCVNEGYGYIKTNVEYNLVTITAEEFELKRVL